MSTERIAVRVLVEDHVHRGRRCARGEVIQLREWQVQWLGTRVQRVFAPKVEPREPVSVALPPSPEPDRDESGGDDAPDDPDPEPEPGPQSEPVTPTLRWPEDFQ